LLECCAPFINPEKYKDMKKKSRTASSETPAQRHIAVVGAGIAGIACARTLAQAGHQVTVFEKSHDAGGRMATLDTEYGGFDHGTQYFTVRDTRFEKALATASGLVRPWSANTVRILDEMGRVVASSPPSKEAHWVATPGMNALVRQWAQPLADAGQLMLETEVIRLEADKLHPQRWQLQTEGPGADNPIHSGFDAVILAIPSMQAYNLLLNSKQDSPLLEALAGVNVAPCWSLMVAFPQAVQPTLAHLGPLGSRPNPGVARLNAGPSRPAPSGHSAIWKTTPSASKPNCSRPSPKSPAYAQSHHTPRYTAGAMPKPPSLSEKATPGTANPASALVATGAWAAGWKTAFCQVWKWPWQFFKNASDKRGGPTLHGSVCTIANGSSSRRITRRGAGQLA
jgi:renalase